MNLFDLLVITTSSFYKKSLPPLSLSLSLIVFVAMSFSFSMHINIEKKREYIYIYIYIYIRRKKEIARKTIRQRERKRAKERMCRVFVNGLGDRGSIPGRVMPKPQKMVLDATLLNTQHYKVRIKGKVEQSKERISTLQCTSVL